MFVYRCGWKHDEPRDDGCLVPQCTKCRLWGHLAEECVMPRCEHCDEYGHSAEECRHLLGAYAPIVEAPKPPNRDVAAAGGIVQGSKRPTSTAIVPYKPLGIR